MVTIPIGRNEARALLDQLLIRLHQAPTDAAVAYQAAEIAIDHGFEARTWPAVARTAERIGNVASLWQMLALLYRGVDLHDRAIKAYERAARLTPADRRIAHGLALTTLEAGLPASGLFERALRLSPQDSDVRLGYVSSLKAEGRVGDALARLQEMLRASPLWIEGHQSWARIHASQKSGQELASLDAAVVDHPRAVQLHALRIDLLSRLASPDERLLAADHALKRVGNDRLLLMQSAIAASEAGTTDRADALFRAVGRHDDPRLALAILRHLVRSQRFAEADLLAARLAATTESVSAWAYRQTAWRATDDPRLDWLEQGGAFIRSYDISKALPPIDRLAGVLRGIHRDIGQPLDQSVQGGTQTDGPLFTRIDPTIRALRRAAKDAVEDYTRSLPAIEAAHPLLSAPRDEPVRFAGSWSVRLTGVAGGHHTNHIHAMSWLSSALYIALPPSVDAANGCLTFGAPPASFGLGLEPTTTVTPAVARLVLFPSYLWHGVTSFAEGERLTAAFDVARPRV